MSNEKESRDIIRWWCWSILILAHLYPSEGLGVAVSTSTLQRKSHTLAYSTISPSELEYLEEKEPYPMMQTDLVCPDDVSADEIPAGAKTLDGRLLCAAECAYGVRAPYFRSASFLAGTVAKRITRGVNSVLIGRTVDGIVISFRGTQTGSPLDWLQNAALYLSSIKEDGIPGKIHTGFYRAVRSLWGELKKVLQDMLASSSDTKDIYITGHSKGGAMASIAAVLLAREANLPNATGVYTFASARVGNSVFRDYFNQQIGQTSYENHLDIIPFLPPSRGTMDAMDKNMTDMVEGLLWPNSTSKRKDYIWDYQPIGTRRFVDENGIIVDEVNKELDDRRIRDIEQKTILSFASFRAAHCNACPDPQGRCSGGYFMAIAPEVCMSMMEPLQDGPM